jgi:hypothetical protein
VFVTWAQIYLRYDCNPITISSTRDRHDTIRVPRTGNDPLSRYFLLRYEHIIRRHIFRQVGVKKTEEEGNKKDALISSLLQQK